MDDELLAAKKADPLAEARRQELQLTGLHPLMVRPDLLCHELAKAELVKPLLHHRHILLIALVGKGGLQVQELGRRDGEVRLLDGRPIFSLVWMQLRDRP